MRILEIMNDFRTVQLHISSHVSRAQTNPPDQASYLLEGYGVMRQCAADAQAILATHFNPGSLGLQSGAAGEGEVQKATMQRLVIQISHMLNRCRAVLLRPSLTSNTGSFLTHPPVAFKLTKSTFAPLRLPGGRKHVSKYCEARGQTTNTRMRCVILMQGLER